MLWAVRHKNGAAASQDGGRVAQHTSRSMQRVHKHARALAREAVTKACFSHGPPSTKVLHKWEGQAKDELSRPGTDGKQYMFMGSCA